MSEYQYYEFQSLERSLTNDELSAISKLSSRVELSKTKAIFTYSYGDFPGNPQQVLAKYFDAMFYIANWGTKQLMFRFPKALIPRQSLQQYCVEDCITISEIDSSEPPQRTIEQLLTESETQRKKEELRQL